MWFQWSIRFSMVATGSDQLPDFNSPEWSNMFGPSTFQYPYDEEDLAALDGSDNFLSSIDVFGFRMSKLLIFFAPHLPYPSLLLWLHLFLGFPLSSPCCFTLIVSLLSNVFVEGATCSFWQCNVQFISTSHTTVFIEIAFFLLLFSLHSIAWKLADGGFWAFFLLFSSLHSNTWKRAEGGFGPIVAAHPLSPTPSPLPSQPPAAPATLQLPTIFHSKKPLNSSIPSTSPMPNSHTRAVPTPCPSFCSMHSTCGTPQDWLTMHLSASDLARLPSPDFSWWSLHLHWLSSSSFFQSGSLWSRHLDLWWGHGWSWST